MSVMQAHALNTPMRLCSSWQSCLWREPGTCSDARQCGSDGMDRTSCTLYLVPYRLGQATPPTDCCIHTSIRLLCEEKISASVAHAPGFGGRCV